MRNGDIHRRICRDCGDVEIQRREAVLRLRDVRWEHHTAEILVAGVGRDDGHVAHDRMIDPGGDLLHLAFGVDRSCHFVLTADGERHFASLCLRVVGHGRFHKSLRRGPEREHALELPIRVWLRHRSSRVAGRWRHVPRIIAADELDLALLAVDRRTASLRHRRAGDFAQKLDAHAARVVVDLRRVILHGNRRPWLTGREVLADRKVLSRACELERLDPGRAERVGSR